MFLIDPRVLENIKIAFQSIRTQLLRTILTILIIAIGIMALVGILTAIEVIKSSISSNFTNMGANTFTIRNRGMTVRIGKRGKGPENFRAINYDEALRFKSEYNYPASLASLSVRATMGATLKFKSKKSNPNMMVFGVDENYLSTSGYDIEKGRNFSYQDMQFGTNVILLGKDAATAIFDKTESPLDKDITVGSAKYKVIGVLKEKGNASGFGGDKICMIPLTNARQNFSRPDMSYVISILSPSSQQIEGAIAEAEGRMRVIRKVPLGQEDNFELTKSDNLANMLIENLQKVTIGATVIGFITLLGAAIGLMNIMLVSVSERTREIGVRKALGATKIVIRRQFLIEAIVICQLGGLLGILLGVSAGNLLALQFDVGFIVPWAWVIGGIILCVGVGMMSGIYPAIKASNLDPIEALRSE
jgi:putative ABC transport system permease protein